MAFNKKIVVVDIDGTIAEIGERLKYLLQTPKDYDSFYQDCFNDKPIRNIIGMVESLSANYQIVFCTSRRSSCRLKTIQWIIKNFNNEFKYTSLLMRANHDHRHDTIVKPNLLADAGIQANDIAFILEDRTVMVDKWRSLGIICLQVREGNF